MTESQNAAPSPSMPPRRWVGRLLALLFVLALAGGAWWLLQRSQGAAGAPAGPAGFRGMPAMTMAPTVGLATAQQGELPTEIEALGTVAPVAQVELRPQVSGVLTEVLFTEGQMVEQGELLARVDARPFEQALAQARGTLAQNEAQLAQARLTLKRYRQLWEQDSIARQDVDAQEALVKQLEGSVQSNRGAVETARINLDYTRITAPLAGRIGLRAVDAGNMVSAGGTPGIATITQMAPIDVRFAVPQDRVPDVLTAQRAGPLLATVLDRSRSNALASGEFLTLDNVIDAATGTLQAKARFENTDGALFPNQFVNLRLRLGAEQGVLVPVMAVRSGPEGDYVYVVDGEQVAHMRPVSTGGGTVETVLVASGLAPGERVVTAGGDRVRDGGPVQLVEENGTTSMTRAGGTPANREGAAQATRGTRRR